MLTQLLNLVFGSKNDREIKALMPVVARINDLESSLTPLSDQDLAGKTQIFKQRLADGQALDDILPEAFAVCREMSRRRLNMRHFEAWRQRLKIMRAAGKRMRSFQRSS